MITIHRVLIGRPKSITDEKGTWESAIYRTPVDGPVELTERGLAGDQVADTRSHGSPDQAVCCHPLEHYHYWNRFYALNGTGRELGPGSVGENWTLSGANESGFCVGDTFSAGSALVQVAGPRYPCSKQERRLGLADFLKQTMQTRRTGLYLRVLLPGVISAGDVLLLQSRPYPDITVERLNESGFGELDAAFAERALAVPELMPVWHYILQTKLDKELSGEQQGGQAL